MKCILLLIIATMLSTSCQSQNLESVAKSFLQKIEDYKDGKIYFDTVLINDSHQLIKFGILGSHQLPYLLIKAKGSKNYEAIADYRVNALLKEIEVILQDLPEDRKIGIIRKVLDISESHLEMEGWDIIEE